MAHGKSVKLRGVLAVVGILLAGVLLAACGSSKSSSGTTATTSASSTAGAGKPAVTLGSKNFAESNIIGELYTQALRAKGFTVKLKPEIGSTELIWKALKAGQIDGYPEYTGVLLSSVAEEKTEPKSEAEAYEKAKAFVEKEGFAMLEKTPFYDTNVLIVKPPYASEHSLSSIGDLKPLNNKFTIGGAPELATREEGLPGIKKLYGVEGKFKPVSIELSYQAIEGGQVDVQSVFSTDGQLLGGKFKTLSDPKHVFGFQNVAPIIKKSVVEAQGPVFSETINKVNALLTIPAMQQMNKAVSIDKQSAESVAKQFLQANGLA